jgi:hypothetical protein
LGIHWPNLGTHRAGSGDSAHYLDQPASHKPTWRRRATAAALATAAAPRALITIPAFAASACRYLVSENSTPQATPVGHRRLGTDMSNGQ